MESLSALLLSNDAGVLGLTNKIFDDYGFDVDVVTTANAAEELVRRNYFDLAIYDNDVPGAMALAREKTPGSPRVVFGMVRRDKCLEVQGKRLHFVVQKPFSADLFLKSLKAAHGVIAQEKRAAFRHDVQIGAAPVTLVLDNGQRSLSNVKILNVSKTGLGVQTGELLPQGATLQFSFLLPETGDLMNVTGAVMWSRDNGQSGVSITHISPTQQKKLHTWIDSRLPPDFDFLPRSNVLAGRDTGIVGSVPQRQEMAV
jgi:hypothetical protein